ncbi:MAG: hypothetical protein IPH07_24435 [Deltaproteobacteria bacterium]|nr:hypothetical protein [Deltaproteobacteria bacterium]
MRATLLLAAVAALLAACDPCAAAARIHLERCAEGDAASCAWVQEHQVTAAGTCLVEE